MTNEQLIKQAIEFQAQIKGLSEMLEKINTVMWEGFMVKGVGFSEKDGDKIMQILNDWAEKY